MIASPQSIRPATPQDAGALAALVNFAGEGLPIYLYEALQLEDKIGTMLPCNVVAQEIGNNQTEIAAIDPVASMQAIDNPRLIQAAQRVQALLRTVIEAL
jgi:uncharacterized protein (DUF302 family)